LKILLILKTILLILKIALLILKTIILIRKSILILIGKTILTVGIISILIGKTILTVGIILILIGKTILILILSQPVVLILVLQIGEIVLRIETWWVGSSPQLFLQYEDRQGQVDPITDAVAVSEL